MSTINIFMKSILQIFLEHRLEEMSSYTPIVRNGWTKAKIIQYLKKLPSGKGDFAFYKLLNSYKNFEEFKSNLYYHGSVAYINGLKPSIAFAKNWDAEKEGGGGYGVRYWSVSLSKSKKVASNFSGNRDSLSIYPVLIKPDAKIINMDLKDSEELEDHIENLWNQGVDGVYIGGGEQELCILNPSCSVMGSGEYQKVFGLNIKDPTDEELLVIWNSRAKKLDDLRSNDQARLSLKQDQKKKNEEEYNTKVDQLLTTLEEYKNGTKTYHSLISIYRDLYHIGIKLIKHMDLLKYKRLIIDSIKDDWDKRTVTSQLG